MKESFKRNIPNMLSGVRLLLVPFIMFYFLKDNLAVCIALLALSAITDIADGKIARKYNYITDFGKIIDPAADKLTLVAVVICIWIRYGANVTGLRFLLFLLLAKEVLLVTGGLIFFRKINKPVGSFWFGKLSTVLFYAAAIIIVLLDICNVQNPIKSIVIIIFVSAATVSAVASLVKYATYAFKHGNDGEKNSVTE